MGPKKRKTVSIEPNAVSQRTRSKSQTGQTGSQSNVESKLPTTSGLSTTIHSGDQSVANVEMTNLPTTETRQSGQSVDLSMEQSTSTYPSTRGSTSMGKKKRKLSDRKSTLRKSQMQIDFEALLSSSEAGDSESYNADDEKDDDTTFGPTKFGSQWLVKGIIFYFLINILDILDFIDESDNLEGEQLSSQLDSTLAIGDNDKIAQDETDSNYTDSSDPSGVKYMSSFEIRVFIYIF